MNIFAVDDDPVVCAKALDDKRVGKLLMEANQMLSLAIKIHHQGHPQFLQVGPGQLTYGFAHKNHPVSIWVRESYGNFLWTAIYARALGEEFQHRFDKVHASAARTKFIMMNYQNIIPGGDRTPFHNSARNKGKGIDFTWMINTNYAYQNYLNVRWANDVRTPMWTNRGRPEFFVDLSEEPNESCETLLPQHHD